MASFNDDRDGPERRPDWSRINQWLLWVGLAAAVAWLFFRHGEHVLRLLPFFIVLACPLMHLFGHGHGHHGGQGTRRPRDDERPGDAQAPRRGAPHTH